MKNNTIFWVLGIGAAGVGGFFIAKKLGEKSTATVTTTTTTTPPPKKTGVSDILGGLTLTDLLQAF